MSILASAFFFFFSEGCLRPSNSDIHSRWFQGNCSSRARMSHAGHTRRQEYPASVSCCACLVRPGSHEDIHDNLRAAPPRSRCTPEQKSSVLKSKLFRAGTSSPLSRAHPVPVLLLGLGHAGPVVRLGRPLHLRRICRPHRCRFRSPTAAGSAPAPTPLLVLLLRLCHGGPALRPQGMLCRSPRRICYRPHRCCFRSQPPPRDPSRSVTHSP